MYTLHIRWFFQLPFAPADFPSPVTVWHRRPAQQHFEPADCPTILTSGPNVPNISPSPSQSGMCFFLSKKDMIKSWRTDFQSIRHAWHFPDWSFSYSNPQKDVEKSISHSKHRDQNHFSIFFFSGAQRCDFFPPFFTMLSPGCFKYYP